METQSLVRTYLSKEEISKLKELAKKSGMTLPGYRDWICKEAIAKGVVYGSSHD